MELINTARSHLQLAENLLENAGENQNILEQALSAYNSFIQICGDSVTGRLGRATINFKLKRYNEVIEDGM